MVRLDDWASGIERRTVGGAGGRWRRRRPAVLGVFAEDRWKSGDKTGERDGDGHFTRWEMGGVVERKTTGADRAAADRGGATHDAGRWRAVSFAVCEVHAGREGHHDDRGGRGRGAAHVL